MVSKMSMSPEDLAKLHNAMKARGDFAVAQSQRKGTIEQSVQSLNPRASLTDRLTQIYGGLPDEGQSLKKGSLRFRNLPG